MGAIHPEVVVLEPRRHRVGGHPPYKVCPERNRVGAWTKVDGNQNPSRGLMNESRRSLSRPCLSVGKPPYSAVYLTSLSALGSTLLSPATAACHRHVGPLGTARCMTRLGRAGRRPIASDRGGMQVMGRCFILFSPTANAPQPAIISPRCICTILSDYFDQLPSIRPLAKSP